MIRYFFILILCLVARVSIAQDDVLIEDYEWLISLTDSIDDNTSFCDECQIPPYLRSYITPRGVQRFALIYRCEGLTKTSAIHYDVDGSIAAACIADSTDMECPFSFVYEEFSLGMSVATIWECTKGFDCASAPKAVLFPSYDIEVRSDLCNSTIITLSASREFSEYLWTSPEGVSSETPSIMDSVSGDFQLIVSDENGCMDTISTVINLQEPVELEIAGALSICDDVGVELRVENFAKYQWSSGESSQSIIVKEPGLISVIVENDQGCQSMSNVEVIDGRLETITIKTDASEIYEGQSISLILGANGMNSEELSDITWMIDGKELNDDLVIDIIASGPMSISVSAINNSGCLISDQIEIDPLPVFRELYMPNIISPNRGNANSTFYIQGIAGTVKLSDLSIYNRWGTLMFFESNPVINDLSSGWNGQSDGTMAAMGVYVYQVSVEYADRTIEQVTGSLTLVL